MQINEIKVSYYGSNRKYTFDTNGFDVTIGDKVIVDTIHGNELAIVQTKPELVEDDGKYEIKKVVRLASNADLKQYEDNKIRQKQIKKQTQTIVKNHGLDMKIVSCELNLDGNKIIINFTSENRVDFRDLVKELATTFKARIELRQIGARDETKVVGGLGPCGRPCCCKMFLNDCEHSSIKMAKNQNLSLNPTKISGLCGKLMCCLAYENEFYVEIQKRMPKINSQVKTKDGNGIAVYNDLLNETVNVKFLTNDTVEIKSYPLSEIEITKYSIEQ